MGANQSLAETAIAKQESQAATITSLGARVSSLETSNATHTSNYNTLTTTVNAFSVSEANKHFDAEVEGTTYTTVAAALAAGKTRIKVSTSTSESVNWTPASDAIIYLESGVTISVGAGVQISNNNTVLVQGSDRDSSTINFTLGNSADFITTSSATSLLIFKDIKVELVTGLITANRPMIMDNCKVDIHSGIAGTSGIHFSMQDSASDNCTYIINASGMKNVEFEYGRHTRATLDSSSTSTASTTNNVVVGSDSSTDTGASLTDVNYKAYSTPKEFRILNCGLIRNLHPVNTTTPIINIFTKATSTSSIVENANLGSGVIKAQAAASGMRYTNVICGAILTMSTFFPSCIFDKCTFNADIQSGVASEVVSFKGCVMTTATFGGKTNLENCTFAGAVIATSAHEKNITNCDFEDTLSLTGDATHFVCITNSRVTLGLTLGGYTHATGCHFKSTVGMAATSYNSINNCKIGGATTITTGTDNNISDSYLTSITISSTGSGNKFKNLHLTGTYSDAGSKNIITSSVIETDVTITGSQDHLSDIKVEGDLSISTGTYNIIRGIHVTGSVTVSSANNTFSDIYFATTLNMTSATYCKFIGGAIIGVITTTVSTPNRNTFSCLRLDGLTTTTNILQNGSLYDNCIFTVNQEIGSTSLKLRFSNCIFEGTMETTGAQNSFTGCTFIGAVTESNATDVDHNTYSSCDFVVASVLDSTSTLASCIFDVTIPSGVTNVNGETPAAY